MKRILPVKRPPACSLIDALDELDDVQQVYCSAELDLPDEE